MFWKTSSKQGQENYSRTNLLYQCVDSSTSFSRRVGVNCFLPPAIYLMQPDAFWWHKFMYSVKSCQLLNNQIMRNKNMCAWKHQMIVMWIVSSLRFCIWFFYLKPISYRIYYEQLLIVLRIGATLWNISSIKSKSPALRSLQFWWQVSWQTERKRRRARYSKEQFIDNSFLIILVWGASQMCLFTDLYASEKERNLPLIWNGSNECAVIYCTTCSKVSNDSSPLLLYCFMISWPTCFFQMLEKCCLIATTWKKTQSSILYYASLGRPT